jgi:hypothetical protein
VTLDSLFNREPPTVRASDADRDRYVEILKTNSAAGRLTDDELAARVDRALKAKTLGELEALVADLPEGNVDPVAELVGGVVRTGVQAARWGLWIGGGAAVLGILLPIAIGLGTVVSPAAGLIAGAVVLVLCLLVISRFRH